MTIVVPTVPTPLPTPPNSGDPSNFDTRADAFLGALSTFQTQTNQLATATYGNALDSAASAVLSGQQATLATQSATAAAAVSNFKGAWSSLSGALNKPATVLHNNKYWFLLNDLTNVALSQPGVSADWSPQTLDAQDLGNVNLNTVLGSGFFSFGTPTNGPLGVINSQLVVSKGSTTIAQTIVESTTGTSWTRGAYNVSTTPVWSDWKRVGLQSDIITAAGGAAFDASKGNYFTDTVSANRTFSFVNVPSGAYSCVVEINHTAGTITFPSGTVWVGSAPTPAAGKRHLFFFQKTTLGAAGWYASALTGFST